MSNHPPPPPDPRYANPLFDPSGGDSPGATVADYRRALSEQQESTRKAVADWAREKERADELERELRAGQDQNAALVREIGRLNERLRDLETENARLRAALARLADPTFGGEPEAFLREIGEAPAAAKDDFAGDVSEGPDIAVYSV